MRHLRLAPLRCSERVGYPRRQLGRSMFERRLVDRFLAVSNAIAVGSRLPGGPTPYEVVPNFVRDDIATLMAKRTSAVERLPKAALHPVRRRPSPLQGRPRPDRGLRRARRRPAPGPDRQEVSRTLRRAGPRMFTCFMTGRMRPSCTPGAGASIGRLAVDRPGSVRDRTDGGDGERQAGDCVDRRRQSRHRRGQRQRPARAARRCRTVWLKRYAH